MSLLFQTTASLPPLTRFADIFTVTGTKVNFYQENGQDKVYFLSSLANGGRVEGFYEGERADPAFDVFSLVVRDFNANVQAFNFIGIGDPYFVSNMHAFQMGGAASAAFLLSRDDEIFGSSAADWLEGYAGVDRLESQGGADILDGGAGADTMEGGADSDTYFVDDGSDMVIEVAGGGTADLVKTSVTFIMPSAAVVEIFSTTDDAATQKINLYGNAFAQTITGNAGENILSDGEKGAADTLKGLGGNDTYIVNNSGDTIVEGSGEGTNDSVFAAVSFDLLAGVHVETLGTTLSIGTTAINLYGNEIAQEITGNYGDNILSDGGKGGADTLIGLLGNDTYRVYNSGTEIVEAAAAGSDTVEAAVNYTVGAGVYIQVLETTNAAGKSALSLYSNEFGQTVNGNAGDNVLRGYGGNDTINGGDGADKISGGLGNDTLAGNTGADTYYFSNALNGTTNVDTIKGFSGIDLISLNSAIFTKAGPVGALAPSAFVANAAGKAADASDRIVYETDTGILRYDPDGTGSATATAFAIIDNKAAMNAGDFVIA